MEYSRQVVQCLVYVGCFPTLDAYFQAIFGIRFATKFGCRAIGHDFPVTHDHHLIASCFDFRKNVGT